MGKVRLGRLGDGNVLEGAISVMGRRKGDLKN